MSFEIVWTHRAKKDLKLLDKAIARRIIDKVDELGLQDTVCLEQVKGQEFYKFRVGKFRVFIEKFPAVGKLLILHVKHRKNAYKNI